ncbi:hypothetical protein B6U84_04460, partial [Candidatus Bathyarchaeota archaeon ex4484_40]
MEFRVLSELCERLSSTTKRNVKVEMAAEFLKRLNSQEVEPAVSMILGRPFPRWDQRTLDISWATLSNIIKRLTDVDWRTFSKVFRETGDIGSTIKTIFERSKVRRQKVLFEKSLTILEVRRVFEAIAEASGQGS